jgi:signal peptidase
MMTAQLAAPARALGPKRAQPAARFRARDGVFYVLLIALVAGVFAYTHPAEGTRPIGGYALFSVLSNSMRSVYPQGTLLLVRQADPASIAVGDDITFVRSDLTTITHRVIAIVEDADGHGTLAFQTQGTDNPSPDEALAFAPNVVGRVVGSVPKIGAAVQWIRDHAWFSLGALVLLFAWTEALRRLFAHPTSARRAA